MLRYNINNIYQSIFSELGFIGPSTYVMFQLRLHLLSHSISYTRIYPYTIVSHSMTSSKLIWWKKPIHGMKSRKSEKYVVNLSNTKRHKDSAVPYLQGLLNKDDFKRRQHLKRLLIQFHQFNTTHVDAESSLRYKQRQRVKPKNWVNYISNLDVITWK